MNLPRRLFFYGTLVRGQDNPAARTAHLRLAALGRARVRGSLYALPDPQGWYPALLPGQGWVQGQLYLPLSGFRAAALAGLDNYEECRPGNHAASLYWRRAITALLDDGRYRGAQAYTYVRPLPRAAVPLPGGDFAAWLAATGLPAFCPARRPVRAQITPSARAAGA